MHVLMFTARDATADRVEGLAAGDRAQLNVTDDGAGIPPGAQRRLFERFHRGEHRPGAGLALSIVDARGGATVAANTATGGASSVADLPLPPRRRLGAGPAVTRRPSLSARTW